MADDDQHDMAEEINKNRQGAEQAKALDSVTDNVSCCCCCVDALLAASMPVCQYTSYQQQLHA
jgi:hypothetical protein